MALLASTAIPYGNACDLWIGEREGLSEVSFAPDPHGGPECLWFCFRIAQEGSTHGSADTIRLVLKHAYNMLGGNRPDEGMRPVVRYAGGDWQRLGKPVTEELPDGRNRVVWNARRSFTLQRE